MDDAFSSQRHMRRRGLARALQAWILGKPAPPREVATAMPRVLIVDDEEKLRKALAIGLKMEGFDVVTAASGEDAMRALAEKTVDIAMIDLMLAGTNGLEVARQIRRTYPSVRIVISSAYHLSARQVERADCGAVGFVPKPYQLSELSLFLRAKAGAEAQPAC